MTEQVRLGNVAERFVQARNVGARLRLRARPLHGEVQKARRALVAGNPVDRIAVDPGLQIREVGSVAAEFARRSAERVQCREPRVLRFERERSEEHTSELQSLMRISYAVFCLKTKNKITTHVYQCSSEKY